MSRSREVDIKGRQVGRTGRCGLLSLSSQEQANAAQGVENRLTTRVVVPSEDEQANRLQTCRLHRLQVTGQTI